MAHKTNLDEGERDDGGEAVEVRVVEGGGRVRRVDVGDPEDGGRGSRRPVGRREREPVVRPGVHRIRLRSWLTVWHSRWFRKNNLMHYLDGDGVDELSVLAEVESVEPDEPVGRRHQLRHHRHLQGAKTFVR